MCIAPVRVLLVGGGDGSEGVWFVQVHKWRGVSMEREYGLIGAGPRGVLLLSDGAIFSGTCWLSIARTGRLSFSNLFSYSSYLHAQPTFSEAWKANPPSD